jgi:pyruvate kinase
MRLATLQTALLALQRSMLEFEQKYKAATGRISLEQRPSAINLLHYLAMRRRDLRSLQIGLADMGVSSLGRAEAHALPTVMAALDAVRAIRRKPAGEPRTKTTRLSVASAQAITRAHTRRLFGFLPGAGKPHLMVTLPSEAAQEPAMVRRMLKAGMTCARINCAHDGPAEWSKMIKHLCEAQRLTGRRCAILMDLPGPKLRTGPIAPGPSVLKYKPVRDALGRVTETARIPLTAINRSTRAGDTPTVQVSGPWLRALRTGDKVKVVDARGRHRVLRAALLQNHPAVLESERTVYLTNESILHRLGASAKTSRTTHVRGIEVTEAAIPLKKHDHLILTRGTALGHAAVVGARGKIARAAHISCPVAEVFLTARRGARVLIDDGRFEAVVKKVQAEALTLELIRVPTRKPTLKADKGINLPDTDLNLPAFTSNDTEIFRFIAQHADMVGLSFLNHERDVALLIRRLRRDNRRSLGIVLKIETRRGVARLPQILLSAMRHERFGVMIARGDLAVEVGYERLAELQEEILWMCEAARCPVIWATQVLESLTKSGSPSRAEVTDAAMAERAECVMLNKGPFIIDAMHTLAQIMARMRGHQFKKMAMLRALNMARSFPN